MRSLETGTAPLDESIELYQRGDRLKRHCEARLKAAQARIDQISLDADGKPVGHHQLRCWLSAACRGRPRRGRARVSSAVDSCSAIISPTPAMAATACSRRCAMPALAGASVPPLLTVAAARLFGMDEERAIRVGAAIEAIHVYSLIHDDLPCMDDDDLRRGKPTVHKAYDDATALLAGDCFHDLAFEILSDVATHEDPFVRAELVLELARASGPHGMAGGQMLDLVAETETLDLSAITRLQQLKTGALIEYAVEAACIMGRLEPRAAPRIAVMRATSAWPSRSPTI